MTFLVDKAIREYKMGESDRRSLTHFFLRGIPLTTTTPKIEGKIRTLTGAKHSARPVGVRSPHYARLLQDTLRCKIYIPILG
jgi:hypothetical protein